MEKLLKTLNAARDQMAEVSKRPGLPEVPEEFFLALKHLDKAIKILEDIKDDPDNRWISEYKGIFIITNIVNTPGE